MDKRSTKHSSQRRLGGWLPEQEAELARFRTHLAQQALSRAAEVPLAPVIQELADLIEGDAKLRKNLSHAIEEATEAGYVLGYASIEELMVVIDYTMSYAPPFSESSLIHCPLNAVLDWPMCMPSGYAVFRDPAFNAQLKRVLDHWCGFLSGPHSRDHLHERSPDGWFSPEADKRMDLSQFLCDPQEPFWGFASWNDFFTRQFRPEERPVYEPLLDKVVVSACEASPYNTQDLLKLNDKFWIKSQPYSLEEIFTPAERNLAESFIGGSLYQAYLSAFNYHRWHAPVGGTITKAYRIDGTYFSEAQSEGVDAGGLNDSQGYITAVATRAVIVIDCDEPAVGQVACVFVGMGDVSSCVIEALAGQHVKKGDELGYFQYGGSSYCLVFKPGVIKLFVPQAPFDDRAPPVKVNAHVATVW